MTLNRMLPGLALCCSITLAGCSSLSSGEQDETLTFTSLPSGASIQVVNVTDLDGQADIHRRGETVARSTTPVTLELPSTSKDGEDLQEYVVAITKTGYARYETRLEAVGSEARMRPNDSAQNERTVFLGWRLEDPRTEEVSHIPYNQIDVELESLND